MISQQINCVHKIRRHINVENSYTCCDRGAFKVNVIIECRIYNKDVFIFLIELNYMCVFWG